jgi:hypothetical protein
MTPEFVAQSPGVSAVRPVASNRNERARSARRVFLTLSGTEYLPPTLAHRAGGLAMSDSTSKLSGAAPAAGAAEALRSGAADAMAKISDIANQAVGEAKKSASSLASAATERAKDAAQERIAGGADLLGHLAASVRVAARELDPNAPHLAGFAREAAGRIDDFSHEFRDKSVEELLDTAAQFAQRQPAVLFGATAACGFLLFRMIKTASSAANAEAGGLREENDGAPPHAEAPPITSGQFHGQ